MATTDDLMEFSAEARTPMVDDLDIEFGDGEDTLDQDMIEDGMDNLVDDDEMADEEAPATLDTDIDFDAPRLEVAEVAEVNMGSRAPSDAASPMAQGGTPDAVLSLEPVTEILEETLPQPSSVEEIDVVPAAVGSAALQADQVSTRDFADAATDRTVIQEKTEAQILEQADDHHDEQTEDQTETAKEVSSIEAGTTGDKGETTELAPQLDEYIETNTQAHTGKPEDAHTETVSLLEHHPVHAIVVDYQGTKMSLFPPSTEHEGSESFLLEDEALCHEPLAQLLAECRRVLKDDVLDGEEVILHIPCLGLAVAEHMAEQMSTTMNDLIGMFLSLSYNDGTESPEALSIALEVKPRLLSRLDYIRSIIAEGKGLSHILALANTHGSYHANAPPNDGTEQDAEAPFGYDFGDDIGLGEHDFDEQFEAHTPGVQGGGNEDDLLEFATPLNNEKDLHSANDELEDPAATILDVAGLEGTGDGAEDFGADELLNVTGNSDEVNLQANTDEGPDTQEIKEEITDNAEANASLTEDTNNSEVANEARNEISAAILEDTTAAEAAGTYAFPDEELDEESDDKPEPHSTENFDGADELTILDDDLPQDFPEDELDDGPAEASTSHTEQGSSNTDRGDDIERPDETDNLAASPSSLKRRRPSFDEAADLLDDWQTPSPQAKRMRPS